MIKHIRAVIQAEVYTLKLLFETGVPLAIVFTLIWLIDYPTVLFGTYLWKLIIDQIAYVYTQSSGVRELCILLGVYLGIHLVNKIIGKFNFEVVKPEIESRSRKILDLRVMRKMASLDSDFFDDPANRDMINVANQSKSKICGNMTLLIREMVGIVTFAGGLVMFLSVSLPVALIYLATCIPGIVIDHYNTSKMDRYSIASVPQTRKKDYYRSILTGKGYAQELRVYGLTDYFKEKYTDLWAQIRKARYAIFRKGNRLSYLSTAFSLVGKSFLIVYSVDQVLRGNYTVGTLSMLVSLSGSVGTKFVSLVKAIPHHYRITIPHINRFRELMQYENHIKTDGDLGISTVPDIEFRDVCFHYPGSDVNVIDHLNLKIPAGKKIGLVGLNGAGKTTWVKLLLRFYEPQSGNILLNGTDISVYSLKDLYRLFGICFQDVNAYSMTARENIALSDISRMRCEEALSSAAKSAGADLVIADFAQGPDANLTRKFHDDGYALSGGQWQKLALARAFFRDSQFIILDEPSSALDPEAEDFIFSSFRKICHGKGGILISHRLSAIMMVDEVVLLKNGKVCEQGSHAALMERGGEYARLYQMQAEKYVKIGGEA